MAVNPFSLSHVTACPPQAWFIRRFPGGPDTDPLLLSRFELFNSGKNVNYRILMRKEEWCRA
jgi:hypothetical protein